MSEYSKKAVATAEELVSEFGTRQKALPVSMTFDADLNPLVRIGTGTVGAAGALIKVMPIAWNAKDILGLPATVYNPHVIKVAFEAQSGGTDPNTWATKLLVLGALLARGMRLEVYESANGDSPDADDFITSQLKATFDASAIYPLHSSQ